MNHQRKGLPAALQHVIALLPRFTSIGSRIHGGLAMTTGLLIVIAVFSIVQLRQQDSGFAQTLEARMPLLVLSSELLSNIDELGQASRTALLVEGKDQARSALSIVARRRGEIGEGLQKLNEVLSSDADESSRQIMSELEQSSSGFLVGMVKFARLVEAQKMEGVKSLLLDQLEPQRAALRAMISRLQQGQIRAMRDIRAQSRARTDRYETALIGLGMLAVSLSLATGWLIVRGIKRPLGEAVAMAQGVAEGDLSKQAAHRSGNEIGKLLDAMRAMQERLKGFVAAQHSLARQHAAGAVSARMDAASFPGAYGEIGQQVNALIDGHVKVQQRVMEVMARYAKGDFNQEIEALPGERAAVKEALDQVKANLKGVNGELMALVAAAGRGEFSVRGDAGRYEYSFREMVQGLNRLMEVNERALKDLGAVLGALAEGDLTERVTSEYAGMLGELKANANRTVDKLTGIVGSIKESVESINVASKEIASGNTDLSQRTEEQAASLEETAASMKELTDTVKQNAQNASQVNRMSAKASEIAAKGGAVVGQVVSTMSSISESSKKIVDIIGVIDGIAFQTNILALNAAVEAARAGEQGRGFAVVATEVRNLAQRSAAAAMEIKKLIGTSVQKVEAGTKLVDEAGKTMDEVVRSVKQVTDIMREITKASQEQSGRIKQVNTAIGQMDEVTQQNAALVEEAAAAAESLEEQARNLAEAVATFKLAGGGVVPHAVPSRPGSDKLSGRVKVLPRKPVTAKPAAAASARAVAGGNEQWKEF